MSTARPRKDDALEGSRGVAALIVVAWHLLLAFDPRRPGVLPDFAPAQSWVGTPWYGLVNGTAAVGFFFVLSGYVLTYRSLAAGDASVLARGAIKRWPRLAGTVALASVASWALFPLGWYRFAEAGRLSHSTWLANFGYGPPPVRFTPSFWDAATQGLWATFLTGWSDYNSSLWTMRLELIGSFVAFGTGLALLHLPRGRARAVLLVLSWGVCFCLDPWLANFPLGVAIADRAASPGARNLPPWCVPALLIGGYAALCYSEGSALDQFATLWLGVPLRDALLYGLGGAAILCAIELRPRRPKFLGGMAGSVLGRLSFPIYLLHMPVLLSAGCMAFRRYGGGWRGYVAATLATLIVTGLVAWPLAVFDVWWTRLLDRAARWLAAAGDNPVRAAAE